MTVLASTIEAAYKDNRDKARGLIVESDVDSVAAKNIVSGQGTLFTKYWEGPQGIITWDYIDGENRSEWAWVTGQLKTANKSITSPSTPEDEMGLLIQTQYQDVWGCSKNIIAPAAGILKAYVTADVIAPRRNAWGPIARYSSFDGGFASDIAIEVGGIRQTSTLGYAWEEEYVGPLPAGEPDHEIDFDTGTNDVPEIWIRRSYTTWFSVNVQPGEQVVRLLINPRAERLYVARRQIIVEFSYI